MIQIQRIDDRTAPVLTCDVCGQLITDAMMAMIKYRTPNDNGQSTTELVYCHKKECDLNRHDYGQWMELRHFLARLLVNSGMPLTSVADAMKGIERLEQFD